MENIKLFETIKRLTSKQDLQINERKNKFMEIPTHQAHYIIQIPMCQI